MTLSLLMAALLVAAGFWLTHPLFTRAKSTAVARRTANVLAHQTRLAEIHADVIAGVLPSAEAEPLRRELDARLVEDARTGRFRIADGLGADGQVKLHAGLRAMP